MKPTIIKPSLYAHYFLMLKDVAAKYGYNLCLHGSMNRDLDLVAFPWSENTRPVVKMIEEFAEIIGGKVMHMSKDQKYCFPHGRESHVININRGDFTAEDPQYYLDISVFPAKDVEQ